MSKGKQSGKYVYVLQFNCQVMGVYETEDAAHCLYLLLRDQYSRHGRWIITRLTLGLFLPAEWKIIDSGESAEISKDWERDDESELER